MWDKVKAFFKNTIVQIVEWVILAMVAAGLIFGGVSVTDEGNYIVLVGGIIDAVALVVTFITKIIKK